jgi:hypothetical protein
MADANFWPIFHIAGLRTYLDPTPIGEVVPIWARESGLQP